MSERPTQAMEPARCTKHEAFESRLARVEEDIVRETARREKAFEVLVQEQKTTNREVARLKVDMAKLLGIAAAVLAIVQIALKFLPIGGGN